MCVCRCMCAHTHRENVYDKKQKEQQQQQQKHYENKTKETQTTNERKRRGKTRINNQPKWNEQQYEHMYLCVIIIVHRQNACVGAHTLCTMYNIHEYICTGWNV